MCFMSDCDACVIDRERFAHDRLCVSNISFREQSRRDRITFAGYVTAREAHVPQARHQTMLGQGGIPQL